MSGVSRALAASSRSELLIVSYLLRLAPLLRIGLCYRLLSLSGAGREPYVRDSLLLLRLLSLQSAKLR